MNFSVFVFSLCPGLMLSVSIEIEEEIGIQIWQVHEGKVNRLINKKIL